MPLDQAGNKSGPLCFLDKFSKECCGSDITL
jgi:hypothetical protein